MLKGIFSILILLICTEILAQRRIDSVGTLYLTRQTPVHDPVLIKEKGTYYLFCTGFGISVFSSKDLKTWKKEKPVFSKPPQWATEAVPQYRGHTWAPDISHHNGKYYLYYSVSAFGKNTSCIGLATNKTLDPASLDFKWEDQGKVIQSVPFRDNWNAIDPNLIVDENGTGWLNFGSFWSGIKLFKLDSAFKKPAEPQQWYGIAGRQGLPGITDSAAGKSAIEGPFIFKKNNYYYLFVSWDYCCRGEKSDYKVVIGRSENLVGPYLDKNGKPLLYGGGSLLLEGDNKEWFGIGHNGIFTDEDGTDYFVAHGYDGHDKGRSKLIIKKMYLDNDNWPFLRD